ncbi:MAG: Trk system potassium transporter TrkA [Oscillospiraceae bacterium]
MKIIIVGDGKVGFTLAQHLFLEHHDVTIIDTSDDALKRAADALDVLCIKGNGASFAALKAAGVATCDILIAATSADEMNMVCCLTARKLGAKYTIARVRNVEYAAELAAMKDELGIDMVINPENATAVEISRLLRFPSAANIETFAKGRVELIGFLCQESDFIVGKPISKLSPKLQGLPMLFCAVERDGAVFIPDGSSVLAAGDKVYVIGVPLGLHQFFALLGRFSQKIRQVFIVGGGRIAHYLTFIAEKLGMQVKIVELDADRCRHLAEVLPHTLIINGDGTEQELLESENLHGCDAFIALTGRDEDNLIVSLYAMQQGIPKVIAKCNRQNYAGIARSVGLESVISPKMITANQILQVVRGMENSKGSVMTALYKIAGGKAEALEFVACDTTSHLGVPLRSLPLKESVLVAIIIHQNAITIPQGSSVIAAGDTVIIITQEAGILDLNDIYEDAAPHSPVTLIDPAEG